MTDPARLHPEDRAALVTELADELERRGIVPRAVSDWMTPEAAQEFLGYTRQHMLRLGVPRHKHGRRVRYKRSELEAWMATGGRKSA